MDGQRQAAFEYALNVAGFRPVEIKQFGTLPPISLPDPSGAETALDAALRPVTEGTPWGDIGRQLSNVTVNRGFLRGFLKARAGIDPHFLFLYAWSGEINDAFVDRELAVLWDIVNNLSPLVRDFEIDESARDRISGAMDAVGTSAEKYDAAYKDMLEKKFRDKDGNPLPLDVLTAMGVSPWLAVALGVAKLLLELGMRSSTCYSTMVFADTDGLSEGMRNDFENVFGGNQKAKGEIHKTFLDGIGFDVPALRMHGHPRDLDLALINRQMGNYLSQTTA